MCTTHEPLTLQGPSPALPPVPSAIALSLTYGPTTLTLWAVDPEHSWTGAEMCRSYGCTAYHRTVTSSTATRSEALGHRSQQRTTRRRFCSAEAIARHAAGEAEDLLRLAKSMKSKGSSSPSPWRPWLCARSCEFFLISAEAHQALVFVQSQPLRPFRHVQQLQTRHFLSMLTACKTLQGGLPNKVSISKHECYNQCQSELHYTD